MPRVAKKKPVKRGRPPKVKLGRPPLSAAAKKKTAATKRLKSKAKPARSPKRTSSRRTPSPTWGLTPGSFERLVFAVERIADGLASLADSLNIGDFIGELSFSDNTTPPPTDRDVPPEVAEAEGHGRVGAYSSDLEDLATSISF